MSALEYLAAAGCMLPAKRNSSLITFYGIYSISGHSNIRKYPKSLLSTAHIKVTVK